MTNELRVLLVDDEAPARNRLRDLLTDCSSQLPLRVVGEADNATAALAVLAREAIDVVLLDIHMPGDDGLALAQRIGERNSPPAIVFITAHDAHAVHAFDLAATDYLLKPVRMERLLAALRRIPALSGRQPSLRITERGQILLVPLDQVLWMRAEQKYVTVHAISRNFLVEESLSALEESWPGRFVRIHRNTLVSIAAVSGLRQTADTPDADNAGWAVFIAQTGEALPVSRRQLPIVRNQLRR